MSQIQTINKSAVAVTIAQAFLVGYSVPIVTMLSPYFLTTDYVGAVIKIWHECLTNPAWLFIFFKSTMNCGVSFALGALMKTNAFDQFKAFFTPRPSSPESIIQPPANPQSK
jgi:hypothetical protein